MNDFLRHKGKKKKLIHLNSNWHQSIGGFVEQHQWSHHVLLLPIDGVGFQPIQYLVVTQENVAFLFEIRD